MLDSLSLPFVKGCGTGAGLIIAIGAQNAFVLKQGITKSHVFLVAILCATIDAILIASHQPAAAPALQLRIFQGTCSTRDQSLRSTFP